MPLIGEPPATWQLFVPAADLLPSELPEPSFNVAETAKMFFGRSASWMRLQMGEVPDDSEEIIQVGGRDKKIYRTFDIGGHVFRLYRHEDSNYRLFSLWDIEPLAWALFERDLAKAEAKYRQWVPNARRRQQLRQISETVFERKRDIYLTAIREVEERLDVIRHLVWYQARLYDLKLPDRFPEYAGKLSKRKLIEKLDKPADYKEENDHGPEDGEPGDDG